MPMSEIPTSKKHYVFTAPLHWAVQACSADCVKRLLEAGAKQNPPLVYSENPLHIAGLIFIFTYPLFFFYEMLLRFYA